MTCMRSNNLSFSVTTTASQSSRQHCATTTPLPRTIIRFRTLRSLRCYLIIMSKYALPSDLPFGGFPNRVRDQERARRARESQCHASTADSSCMQKLPFIFAISLAAGCHLEDSETVENRTRLLSSTINAESPAEIARFAPSCSATNLSCTPTNIEGRIYSASIMLGPLGPAAFGMTLLAGNDEILKDPSKGHGGTTYFNLRDSPLFTGKITIPTAEEMPSPPVVSRIELSYDYLDVEFTLQGSAIDGTYRVREVFARTATAADVTGEMQRGDKLISTPQDPSWKWCNATQCSADRASVALGLLVEQDFVNYVQPRDGNPYYLPYVVEFTETMNVSHEQISSPANVWRVDFDLRNAILFHSEPAGFTDIMSALAAFHLSFAPNQQQGNGESSPSIRAKLEIGPEVISP